MEPMAMVSDTVSVAEQAAYEAKLAWPQVAAAEPSLVLLVEEAGRVRDRGGAGFCANELWYDQFKPRLVRLVGWKRPKDAGGPAWLWSMRAYDVAYRAVYAQLPDCRACGCASIW